MMGCTTAPGEKTLAPARALHKDHTYELVSKVAYLIGVPLRIFENEHEPPKLELYDQLERDKNARIIRNLCIIRTAIERNYKRINDAMRMECRGLLSMPELIPSASLQQLSDDGVNFITKFSTKLCHHVIEVNRLISDRINNCKSLFPVWINWAYLKELFLMPDGLTESGTKAAAGLYYANLSYYPYQMYINWAPADEGNILYSDRKFADLLYQWHCDAFTEYSKVSDAGAFVKNNIYDFVNASEKTVIVVDCENSDPYKLCATLRNLDREIMQKITTILLFDDIHTVTAWRILESYTDIPVEHIMTERIKQNKSLVDIKLTARACQEHYQNHVDSFVIVSSDSDYQFLHGRKSVVDLLHFRHFHGAHHKDFHFFCADMGSSFPKEKRQQQFALPLPQMVILILFWMPASGSSAGHSPTPDDLHAPATIGGAGIPVLQPPIHNRPVPVRRPAAPAGISGAVPARPGPRCPVPDTVPESRRGQQLPPLYKTYPPTFHKQGLL